MNKAVFLDRDGVINNDTGHYYIYNPDDFVLNDGVIEALQFFQNKGYMLIVISNQGGISRGIYSKDQVEIVHSGFLNLMQQNHIQIDEIYYCPHHNEYENCLCRKPKPLMIEKALARFNIDRAHSLMIGDNAKDVEVAKNAGIKGIQIAKNSNLLAVANQLDNGGEV